MEIPVYQTLLVAGTLMLSVGSAWHALLRKREPRSALGWCYLCLTLPIAGPVLYFVFGVNRVQTRARKLRERVATTAATDESAAQRAASSRLHATALPAQEWSSNDVDALFGVGEAYPRMLAAIDAAHTSIYLSTYIFRHDAAGLRFVDALRGAARRGVAVYVLIDGIGQFYSLRRVLRPLRQVGVHVALFLPPRLVPPSLRVNLRNHRKILVTDHTLAFTGGMNISNPASSIIERGDKAGDIHFSLRGPAVHLIEDVFLHDWYFATGSNIASGARDAVSAAGNVDCRIVIDGPDENLDALSLRILSAVSSARKRVVIMTPYFLPTRELIGGLKAAAISDVQVQVVLPLRSNLRYVDWATRKMLWELLQTGVEVYYLPPPFRHTKLLVVDSDYVMMGSANWDTRSLRLNFEIAAELRSAALCRQLLDHCNVAIAMARRVSLADMDARSLPARTRDAIAWLASPYL